MKAETQGRSSAISVAGIDVVRLEKELAAMWQPPKGEDGKPAASEAGVTRVCVLNLIVYATHREERAQIDQLLDQVMEQVPSRAVILIADREAETAKLEAYVSTRCQVGARGGKQVCGEQITIEAAGGVIETVSTAIEPLLMPDVPVFLWWKDIPDGDDKLFRRLVRVADRVVIDSLAFDKPHEDFQQLDHLIRTNEHLLVSDINWGRLTSWRTLLASFWDVPDYRPALDDLATVVVEYDPPDAAHEEIAPQALLIAGWLAGRLGWQFTKDAPAAEGATRRLPMLTKEGRHFTLEFRGAPDRAGHDGLLASVTFTSAAQDASFHVAVNEAGTKLDTEARVGESRHIDRVLAYEQKTEGERLSRELGLRLRDRVYEATVASAAAFVSALTSS
ncbi:MAG TPA: glucose-6-phosphate dehydrogenase assembly protein OpcA [Pyrinomonadaceae bacterium]|jgi:glucose-6-phosphate dehydrogenase assembly protein OpcA